MPGRLWCDRAHAARIRKAARDGGFIPWVEPGLRVRITTPDSDRRVVLTAQFTGLGRLKPSTVLGGRIRTAYLFRNLGIIGGATPADVTDSIVGWLASGAPEEWTPLPTRLQQRLAHAREHPDQEPDNVIPFRRQPS
jgi:hypothetical protein